MANAKRLGVILYPDFELLDVFGPVEMFGNLLGEVEVTMVGEKAGTVRSAQGPSVVTEHGFADCPHLDMFLVPGGMGTRAEVENPKILHFLRARAAEADIVMTVCTGTALLAKAGLLDGRRATTNKMFFQWVVEQGPKVRWVKEARWVEDGKFVTSSGVSAGMDMALHLISRLYGEPTAKLIAAGTEYQWHTDPTDDPFARLIPRN